MLKSCDIRLLRHFIPQGSGKSMNLKIHRDTYEIDGTCIEIWIDVVSHDKKNRYISNNQKND